MTLIKQLFQKEKQELKNQADIERTQVGCQISQATIQMSLGF